MTMEEVVVEPLELRKAGIAAARAAERERYKGSRKRADETDLRHNTFLTDMQKRFVYGVVFQQLNYTAAARMAGFANPNIKSGMLMRTKKILLAIDEARAEYARATQITRKQVLDGFLEGIEMAKTMSDPTAFIRGWREVGLMCGFYAPVVKKISVSHSGEALINKMQAMTDEELLALAENAGKPAIEGDYVNVSPAGADESEGEGLSE